MAKCNQLTPQTFKGLTVSTAIACIKTDQLEQLHSEWSLGSEHEDCMTCFLTVCHPPYQLKQSHDSSALSSISHYKQCCYDCHFLISIDFDSIFFLANNSIFASQKWQSAACNMSTDSRA